MTRDHHHQFYGHHHHHQQQQMMNQIQGFDEANHHYFGSNTNMGMMIDFSKQQHHHNENLLMVNNDVDHSHHHQNQNQRQSQGLSLSLSSSNPTSINLQFQQQEGYSGKSTQSQNLQHSHQVMMMMMMNNNHHQFQIGSSKYLSPTQELLSEFCSLGVKQSDEEVMKLKKKIQKAKQHQDEDDDDDHHHHDNHHDNYASTSSKKHVPPLHSLEFMELQKRKSKLISMLEELKRRYGHYREQMRGAVAAFETAVGIGAAEIYTALAARAMSRHFRCLKDGIVSQIQETSQALGEKEDQDNNRGVSIAPRGETPRLKLLDQALRQQKSFRQMSLVDAHPWRPQRGLPERAVTALRAWLFEHFLHPYPSDVDKHILARQTGLSRSQVSNWFINARVRLWKPMIEEMYCEETRIDQDHINHHNHDHNKNDDGSISILNPMINIDSKPDHNQLIRIEPESLSSIVTNPTTKINHKNDLNQGAATTSFGSTFDFSLYGNQAVTYAGEREGTTRGVSLTLGLQRNDGNGGVSLAFSPVTVGSQGGALFYGREHMEDCQQGSVEYGASMLDGDQSQNLPYRNLMGAQLLHDIV